MNTKKQDLAAALKNIGYNSRQVSIKYDGSLDVTIRDPKVNAHKVEQIARGSENYSRCEHSGEILSGGNTFVFMRYTDEVKAEWAKDYHDEIISIMEEIKDGKGGKQTKDGHFVIFRTDENRYFVSFQAAYQRNEGDTRNTNWLRDLGAWMHMELEKYNFKQEEKAKKQEEQKKLVATSAQIEIPERDEYVSIQPIAADSNLSDVVTEIKAETQSYSAISSTDTKPVRRKSDEETVNESDLYFKKYYRLAYHGTVNVYHDCERVARQIIETHSAMILEDVALIETYAKTDEAKAQLPVEIQRYKENFEKYFVNWLHAASRCISSFITGGSNFPVKRAEKANASERARSEEFYAFREKAKTAIRLKLSKVGVPVLSELQQAELKLEKLIAQQERMKAVNTVHGKWVKNPLSLETSELPESDKKLVRDWKPYYSYEKHPFQPFELQNNGAEIRRMTDRVEILKTKEFKAENVPADELTFDGGVIIQNYEIDRLQLKYDAKPDSTTIQKLKNNGFKWAPSQMAWQRQLTADAKYKCFIVTGINLQTYERTAQ